MVSHLPPSPDLMINKVFIFCLGKCKFWEGKNSSNHTYGKGFGKASFEYLFSASPLLY